MDEAGFILWQEDQDDPNGYDEIIENEAEMEELNDMIEENVEGYEEVHVMDQDTDVDNDDHQGYYNIDEGIISVPQENLIYLTDDGIVNGSSQIGVGMSHLIEQRVEEAENKIIGDEEVYTSTVEEVITEEDWIQSQGEEFVQVAMEQIVQSENQAEEDNDTVPLQTDQDEYTTSRPYPCDFCSRRFRKKANLMNHMVAHQNDRPHMCNLCGSRYVRRCDLLNHLKIHAYNIDEDDMGEDDGVSTSGGKKKSSYDERLFRNDDHDEDLDHDDYDYDKNYDYGYYAKPTPPKATVKKKSTPKVIAKRAPAVKTIKQMKKEKRPIVKQDPLSSFHGYDNDNSRHPSTSKPKDRTPEPYVEKYPITDDRKPFVCQHCGVSFTREKALESHKKVHEENEPSFDCEVCGDSFYDNSALEEHLDSRHNYTQTIQKNKVNKSVSKPRARQQQPINTMDFDEDDSNSEYEPSKNNDEDDEDDDEGGFSCDRCEISFRNAVSLKRHIKTHFIKPELLTDDDLQDGPFDSSQFCCNVCGESFTEALDLLAHAEIHARFQPFKCQLCGETFFEENKIKIHLIDNHQGELTESSCKLCGKQCRDQRSLIKHSWEHSREKNHPCSKCGKTFHNKARLKRHISSHRNKSVMCEICHEEFPDGRSLMNHRHSHTKSNQFPCHECGKTFGSRSSQQIHIRIHTGERPYGCRFCWKAFADGGTLRKHERIHTGEKPYCCLVCPRAFNQRVVLREHIRSHHSAPDPDNGTTLTPYYCSLCGDLFPVSLDLIHHLIEHSDASTAAKRVPVTGPRKYKRRRKMKPDEYDASIDKSVENEYHSDVPAQKSSYKIKQEPLDFEAVQQQHQNKQRESTMPYGDERSFMDPENYKIPEEIFQSTSASGSSNNRNNQLKSKKEDLMNELTTAVSKKKLKPGAARPKMIYTQKTRVAATDGKRKTKTMITKQVVQKQAKKEAPVSRQRQKARDEQSDDNENSDDDNYSMRYQTDIVNDLQEILGSPSKTNDEVSQNEEYYEDLDDEDALGRRRSRRRVVSKYGTTMKARKSLIKSPVNQKPTTSKTLSSTSTSATKEDIDLGIVKQEIEFDDHLCGICGESFKTRVQLLTHVPIHI